MKTILSYRNILILCVTAIMYFGCGVRSNQKIVNKRVTLWRNDKIPYGTWYAYDKLKYIFPNAKVTISKSSPDRFSLFRRNKKNDDDDYGYEDKKSAYIIIAERVMPDEGELQAIMRMVINGKHVFISSLKIGENLLDTLHLKTAFYTGAFNQEDSLTVSVDNPVTSYERSYTYPGISLYNYFTEMDSTVTTILGKDHEGRANFVRISYKNGGSIYLHVAPAAFTNFFLLHKENKGYYDDVFSYIPKNMELVSWDDYFRYSTNGSGNGSDKKGFSALGWIMKQPSLAAATWLSLLMLLFILVFESKRRQRMIPALPAVKNASVDFVKTIGRLYFQRKDNKNLAWKITAFFLDHVRSRYNIRAALGDEDFAKRLSYKSGYDFEATKSLLYYMKYVQDDYEVTDESLLRLNQKLENFYATSLSSTPIVKKKQDGTKQNT